MRYFSLDAHQDFGNCFLIFMINKVLYVFVAIVKFAKQSTVIIRLGILESQGVSKGAKPIHHLICNYTNSKNKYGLGMGITTVIKIFHQFLFQKGGIKTAPGVHVLYTI